MNGLRDDFFKRGWCRFPFDPALADWVDRTLPAARAAVADPANAEWLRCGGTWFAGVNILGNDGKGGVPGGVHLSGLAVDFVRQHLDLPDFEWESAQISICYPGYPQPMDAEPEPAFRYRQKRDAAHVDGLLPEGPDRRRHLREYHGFLLGIPMAETSADASPFVIWEGSHEVIRESFQEAFAHRPPATWGDLDITEAYQATRRRIFDACDRVEVAAAPGEAYLVHRLALHGVAPWGAAARAGPDGRMIAYFRPEIGGPADWLEAP